MMKKTLLTTLLLFIITLSYSQATDWVLRAGGPFSDKGISIDTDTLGNIYICGFFNNGAIFGNIIKGDTTSTTTSPWGIHHNKEICLAKLDSNGTFLWARYVSGSYDDRGLGLYVSPDGHAYVSGTCWGHMEVHIPGPNIYVNAQGGHDESVMIKYTPNGGADWAKLFGGSNQSSPNNCPFGTWSQDDHSYDVVVDNDGFIYLTGFFSGYDIDLGATTLNNPNWNNCEPLGYVAKMDQNGNFLWAKKFSGVKDHRGSRDNRLAIDHFSNIYVVGGFQNTGTYGQLTLTSNGEWDAFIFKMSKDGDFIWARNVGSNKKDRADGIAIDYADNIYINGEYRNPMVFAGANASNGTDTLSHAKKRDVFVAKITTNGDWVWAKRARSKGTDKPYQMSVDDNMQVFIGGSCGDSMKFNNNIILSLGDTSTNAFMAQLDGSDKGDWAWAKMGGGPMEGFRTGDICEDGGDNVYAVGFFQGPADFDGITHTSYLDENDEYKKDIFVWKVKKDLSVNITPSNTIYIDVVPPGSGTISLTGTGTLLTTSANVSLFPCLQSLSDSTNQLFNAFANAGYQFDYWEWGNHTPSPSINSTNTVVNTVSDDTLIVHFEVIPVDTIVYIVQPPGAGTITVDGTNINSFPSTQIYNETTSSSLVANPNATFTFSNWEFNSPNLPNPNASSSNITITWLSNDTCIVHFNPIPTYDITYMVNPIGAGSIDVNGTNISSFPTTQNYLLGTNINLIANDNPNFSFTHWATLSSTLNPSLTDDIVDFNVYADDTIIAHYDEVDTLWIITNPPGVATLEIEQDIVNTSPFMGLYKKGSIVHIKATPNGTNIFNQWNLNNNNLPDYNAITFFNFVHDDTLYAHFNNVLALNDLGEDIGNVIVYPNVVENEFTIKLSTLENSNITIELINTRGQKVKNLFNGEIKPSYTFEKTFRFNGKKGIYFIRINSAKTNSTFKIVKI